MLQVSILILITWQLITVFSTEQFVELLVGLLSYTMALSSIVENVILGFFWGAGPPRPLLHCTISKKVCTAVKVKAISADLCRTSASQFHIG